MKKEAAPSDAAKFREETSKKAARERAAQAVKHLIRLEASFLCGAPFRAEDARTLVDPLEVPADHPLPSANWSC